MTIDLDDLNTANLAPDDPRRFQVTYRRTRHYIDPLPACAVAEADTPGNRYTSVSTLTKRAWPGVYKKGVDFADGTRETFDLDLVRAWLHLVEQDGIDVRDEAHKRDFLRSAAADLARASERGNAVHRYAEALIGGHPAEMEPAGAAYATAVRAAVGALGPMREMLVERVVFNRELGYSGTFDLAFCDEDGRWTLADWKSRGLDSRLDPFEGEVAQVAGYSSAAYYIARAGDVAVRVPMPPISRLLLITVRPDDFAFTEFDVDHARAAWLDLLECDRVRARGQSLARKARGEVVVTAVDAPASPPSPGDAPPAPVAPGEDVNGTGPPPAEGGAPGRRAALQARADLLKARGATEWIVARWPTCPGLRSPEPLSDDQLHLIDMLLTQAEAQYAVPFAEHDATLETPVHPMPVAGDDKPEPAAWVRPDDGAPLDEPTTAALRASVDKLPHDCQAWITCRLSEALRAGRPVVVDKQHTTRSLEIIRALSNVALCPDRANDKLWCGVLGCIVLGTEDHTFPLGALFGSLTIGEASSLAEGAARHYDAQTALPVDQDGSFVLATV